MLASTRQPNAVDLGPGVAYSAEHIRRFHAQQSVGPLAAAVQRVLACPPGGEVERLRQLACLAEATAPVRPLPLRPLP